MILNIEIKKLVSVYIVARYAVDRERGGWLLDMERHPGWSGGGHVTVRFKSLVHFLASEDPDQHCIVIDGVTTPLPPSDETGAVSIDAFNAGVDEIMKHAPGQDRKWVEEELRMLHERLRDQKRR